jgi:hypothetical protein
VLCVEMEEDKHLDGRHAIEEAMSAYLSYPVLTTADLGFQHAARALMRNCPKCKKGTRPASPLPPSIYQCFSLKRSSRKWGYVSAFTFIPKEGGS